MDCSTPGFPVLHQLPELAHINVHHVSNAIQPSHPLLSPSPPALSLPRIRVFSNESILPIKWPKYWSFSFSISPSNEYSGLISLGLTGLISLLSKGFSRVFSSTKCFESLYAFKNYTEQMLNKSALNHPWFQQEITREIKNILNWLKVKTQQIKIYGTKLNQCLEKNLWL